MKKYRIGLVGCGGIARAHTEGYRAIADDICEVVAGCDIHQGNLDNFCDKYEVPLRFTDPKELIDSGEVDVIALLTPPAIRAEVIFPAFERGIHMLVEKPFAENLPDAVSFVKAAQEAGVKLAINQELRFMPNVLRAKEIIDSGELGEIRFIAHDHFQNRTRTGGWRKDEERLEISIFSIHILDRIRWLMGRPPETVSAVTRYWDPNVRGESFTSLTVQFEGGAMGTMISNWHSPTMPESRLRVDGTRGSLLSTKSAVASDGPCTLTVQPLNSESRQYDCSRQSAFTMAMGESMKHLLDAISAGIEPLHSGRDNLQTMAIVDAAYLSASRNGAKIDVAQMN